jgi:uncharacterized GH25 family protein
MFAHLRSSGLLLALLGLVLLTGRWANSADSPAPPEKDATISGKVVDADGQPVANARISVRKSEWDRDTLSSTTSVVCETNTAADGSFRLEPLEAAFRHLDDLLIEAEGYAPQYVNHDMLVTYPGGDFDLGTIQMNPGCVVTGQVLDVDGQPCANAPVTFRVVRYYLGHTITDITSNETVATDEQGRFRTPPLAVGTAIFTVHAPERQVAYQMLATEPRGELALPEPIRLEQDVPLPVQVVDEAGRPIEGVTIRTGFDIHATTDADGRFVLRGFGPEARLQVRMAKDGYAFVNLGVKVGPEGVTRREVGADDDVQPITTKDFVVTMPHVAWIEGDVLDADTGEPVNLDKVVLCTFVRQPNGEILLNGCTVSRFEQPTPGHFRVPYSRPDEYHLTISAQGYHDGEAFTPVLSDLQPVSGLVAKLKPKSKESAPQLTKQRITGTVTCNGRAVESGWVGLWIVARPRNTPNAYVLRGRTTSGWGGKASAAKIHDGQYSLDVRLQGFGYYVVVDEPGHAITQVGPLRIAANETKHIDIECVAGGAIAGRVNNVPAAWRGNLWAIAFTGSGVRAETRVAADGAFTFERLPPGRYGLKVGHDGYQDADVPGHEGLASVPADAWGKISDPWRHSVRVKLASGQTVDGVELELPGE